MLLGVVAFASLWFTLDDYGYAIDEASYLWVAREERAWFADFFGPAGWSALSAEGLARRWHFLEPPGQAAGHSNFNLPVAMHLLNVGWLIGHSFLDELTTHRLASVLLFSLTVVAAARVLSTSVNLVAGIVGGTLLIAMPRVFGHAHLAATETPLGSFWTLTVLGLISLAAQRTTPPWVLALLLSLTMATKLSGWFLAPLVLASLLMIRPVGGRWGIVLCVVLPALFIFALTPTLWHDPIGGMVRYVKAVRANPWTIPTFYLGQGFDGRLPPESAWVMLAVTTPIFSLLMGCAGIWVGVRDLRWWIPLLSALILPIASTLGFLPTHDGERHLLPAQYSWALLAAVSVGLFWERVGPSKVKRSLVLLVCAIGLLEPISETWRYRAHGLCFYNRAVGGLRGAADLGFEISYWFEALPNDGWRELLADLPAGSSVFLRPDHPGLDDLRRWGVWRSDLRSVGPGEADYELLYLKRAAYLVPSEVPGRMAWTDLGERAENGPALRERRFDGVRIVGLHRVR